METSNGSESNFTQNTKIQYEEQAVVKKLKLVSAETQTEEQKNKTDSRQHQ